MADDIPADRPRWTAKVWFGQTSLLATVPFGVALTPNDWELAKISLLSAEAAGFTAEQPTPAGQTPLEQGERRETVGAVCRKQKEDGTPLIALYATNDRMTHKFLNVYLNLDNPDSVPAFERASKMALDRLPLYEGNDTPERGTAVAKKYVTPTPHFSVIYENNPKYDAEEAARIKATGKPYLVPKHRFVRWADQQPPQPVNGHTEPAKPSVNLDWATTLAKHSEWLATNPTLDKINKFREGYATAPDGIRTAMAKKTREHCLGRGWVVADNGDWVEPVKDTDPIPF